MDMNALYSLQAKALDIAASSGKIEDVEKAANISKQIADVEKQNNDAIAQPRMLRYEAIKTGANLLVPLLAVITLSVTVYMQTVQMTATREANEDTEWREAVKNVLSQLSRPKSVLPDPQMAMSLLAPYSSRGRHQREAELLSVELLSRVPSSARLTNYIDSHHLGEDLAFLTDFNREMRENFLEFREQLKATPNAPPIMGQAQDTLIEDLGLISARLSDLYHQQTQKPPALDLSGLYLYGANLANLDLSAANLDRVMLESTDLSNTKLGAGIRFSGALFLDSHWWDANEIAKPLLQDLIDNAYPYYNPDEVIYADVPPPRETYVGEVLRLCKRVQLTCAPENLKYGAPPPVTTPAAKS